MKISALTFAFFTSLLLLIECSSLAPSKPGNSRRPLKAIPTDVANTMESLTGNRINGEVLRAFLVAYEVFRNDREIPEPKRQIQNYEIEFRQTPEAFIIFFFPKIKSDEQRLLGGETELGKEVSYSVSKANYRVIERLFYR